MKLWISYFLHDAFPLVTRFFFCKNFDFLKKNLESPLIFILFFLRENKIRNKTLNVTPYLEKKFVESQSQVRSQVTYWRGTVVNRNTPLSQYTYDLY